MTPEEQQIYLAQLQAQARPRKRNPMWAMVRDSGSSPFDNSSVFDDISPFESQYSPFFPRRRRA
jgi:hypothetical protein